MELPAEVKIHNETLSMKGRDGRLLAIHPEGFFELTTLFGNSEHRVLLPIAETVLIASLAEEDWETGGVEDEIER